MVLSYLSCVDLLKLSEEELTFITGEENEAKALEVLKLYALKAVLVSQR